MRRLVAVAVVLCLPALGVATDAPIPARRIVVKAQGLVTFVARAATSFDLPDAGSDPTVTGGVLRVFDTAGVADTYVLPAGGWTRRGSGRLVYRGAGTPSDPCRRVAVSRRAIRFRCVGAGVTIKPPFTGDVGVVLEVAAAAKRYCAELGGTTMRNDDRVLRRIRAAAPTSCPFPAIPPDCCGGNPFVGLRTVDGFGTCGQVLDTLGLPTRPFSCARLYFGGGQNSVLISDTPSPLDGLIENVARLGTCADDVATLAAASAVDTGSELTCTAPGCRFGAPLPIPNPASPVTSVCVDISISAGAAGMLDCAAGALQMDLPLSARVYLAGDIHPDPGIQPCPRCVDDTCRGGPNDGGPCIQFGNVTGIEYPTSHDCPPDPEDDLGALALGFALDTGAVDWTAAPSGSQARVFCGYCRDADFAGAFETPANACLANGAATGPGCSQPFESCEQRSQGAFGPNGGAVLTVRAFGSPATGLVSGPQPATLASVFCIPPTFNPTLDSTADLPGPGAVALPATLGLCPAGAACP